MSGKNRMVVIAATFAVVALLVSAALTYAQADAGAKVRANYGPNYAKNPSSQNQAGSGFSSSQNADSRQSYSYEPSDSSDNTVTRGKGCHPKFKSSQADDAKKQSKKQSDKQWDKQAQKQQSRRSYSQKPSDKSSQSDKSAQSDVVTRGKGCHPKFKSNQTDESNKQAQKQQSRRSYSHDPSTSSESKNQNWSESKERPWQYQKTSPNRYQN